MDVVSYLLGKNSAGGGGGGDLVAPTSISFTNQTMETFTAKKDIDFTNLKSIPTFQNCTNMTTFNANAWKTTKTLDFGYMCYNCSSLTSVDFSKWDQVNVNSLFGTFAGCSSLERLDLSNFYNDGVTSINQLFSNDNNLTYIDMSNFDFTRITNTSSAFAGVPTDCLIYVKDQSQVDWFTTKFPSYTNVQIK